MADHVGLAVSTLLAADRKATLDTLEQLATSLGSGGVVGRR